MSIRLIEGDITKIEVDVIVNAANSRLQGGGGVDGAIHRAGGPEIMEQCREIGYCATGDAVMTAAGRLPSKKVIHTVGPVWKGGSQNEEHLLASCYRKTMELAIEEGFSSLAFPNISTGVYGFPKVIAAEIAIDEAKSFVQLHPKVDITFVCFDAENHSLYSQLLD